MRRLIALSILGLLLAVAVGVLYTMGRAGLEAERARIEAEAGAERRQALKEIRAGVELALNGLSQVEAARPYYEYRHLYLPPDVVSTELALVPSPISATPPEPLVRYYFEYREGRLASPAFLSSDFAGEEAPTPFAAAIRSNLRSLGGLVSLFDEELGPPPGTPPTRSESVDAYCYALNMDPSVALEDLARAQYDEATRGKMQGDWNAYQNRQGKTYGGSYVPPNQRGQQVEQQGQQVEVPREDVPVSVFPFRWIRVGVDDQGWPEHLLAVRRIQVDDGRSWLQGFALDVSRLRAALLPELIASHETVSPRGSRTADTSSYGDRLGSLKQQVSYRRTISCDPVPEASTPGGALRLNPPLEMMALSHTNDFPAESADLLGNSRRLLDGSLSLVFVVVLLGGMILLQAAIAERRLARQRSDFVAALTHELKAPLTGMRALAELLRDGIVTDEGKRQEYYASILGESERLSRLVQNVLDASRIERGAPLQASVNSVDPAPLLRDLAASFRPRFESEGVILEVDVPDLPAAMADSEAFLQIVANLLDNAFKYGRGEERWIRLSAAPEGSMLVVRVADRGPGVPASERGRVFRRFYRSPSSPREVGGAGLGLAIAQAQASAMNGRLSLEDVPQGACFRLDLPLDHTV